MDRRPLPQTHRAWCATSPKSTGSAATGGEAFDLRGTGFDHMRSMSTGGPTLTSGRHGSSNSGLIHSPIADREYGAVLTSKDSDNIPFEMSFEADHP